MWDELCRDGLSASELADRHGIHKSYASRILRINFLAPEIVEAILSGRQPAAIDARALLGLQDLPLSWTAQKLALNVH